MCTQQKGCSPNRLTCMKRTPRVPPARAKRPMAAGKAVARQTVMADRSSMELTEVRADRAMEAEAMSRAADRACDSEARDTSSSRPPSPLPRLDGEEAEEEAAREGEGVVVPLSASSSPPEPKSADMGHREAGGAIDEGRAAEGRGSSTSGAIVVAGRSLRVESTGASDPSGSEASSK